MSYLQKSCIALSIKIQTAEDNVTNRRARNLKPPPPYLNWAEIHHVIRPFQSCFTKLKFDSLSREKIFSEHEGVSPAWLNLRMVLTVSASYSFQIILSLERSYNDQNQLILMSGKIPSELLVFVKSQIGFITSSSSS